uniref:Protein phosphatase 1 regulatory subunit 19 n=1 Tax=Electrophorus electricus TaxID=8005 RepID=A0AAY5EIH1_ELEEL
MCYEMTDACHCPKQVMKDCNDQLMHWKKVEKDYESLQERLITLPDKLSYDVMVPFGPLAFSPGKLVHTNEVMVLLGDNWFAKCSAKQAEALVAHRQKLVKKKLDDLHKVMKSFRDKAEFTADLEKITDTAGDFVDIREVLSKDEEVTKGKPRVAHKPNSKPKEEYVLQLKEEQWEGEGGASQGGVLSETELWARLDELERLEEEQDEVLHESCDSERAPFPVAQVRINTGKNTTLKFSERKEQKDAKRKKKSVKCNGHTLHEHHKITTPADIYRVFVDVVNGEPVPRKSILKSRSRENSVCSDTSESSTADFEERRALYGHEEGAHSAASNGVTEDGRHAAISLYPNGRVEAFSGTVVEKDPLPVLIPHLTITPPALPTIPERKQEEVGSETPQEVPKRVSKFKAARLQQK